jgi:molybdopterin molybdotransferase
MKALTPGDCEYTNLPRVDEAVALIRSRIMPIVENEDVVLYRSAGRILAEDVKSLVSVPPCERSAMDGYAFRAGDTQPLQIVGRSLAGKPFRGTVNRGACVAIATGGTVPDGCDSVAMHEHCSEAAGGIYAEALPGANVRHKGEDFRAGDILAPVGTRLSARHLALLASGGVTKVAVRRRLRIAIFSIGDELCPEAPDRIHDANRAMLWGMCDALGADITDLGILPDRRDGIAQTLACAALSHDAIISSASTSVGDEDHVRGALLDCGGFPLLVGVAVKPGKPIAFSLIGGSLHIALPGNPAAAFVTFAVMGVPLLRHLAGSRPDSQQWSHVRAGFSYCKRPGIREYLRVILRPGADGVLEAVRLAGDGSAMLASLAASDGLVCLGEDETRIEAGSMVSYRSFAELIAP